MEKAFELLAELQDGRPRSGESIARTLGISRAAIWSRVKRLRAVGVEIHAVPGKGYRLPGGYEFLDETRIRSALVPAALGQLGRLVVTPTCDSTNERLLQAATTGDIHGQVWLAEFQTRGRGRRGDTWLAPPGSGLCFSMGWRFDSTPASIGALSLAVGVALLRAVERAGAHAVALKWPNDLISQGRKLAGVLIEMRAEFGGPATVVIGIGVNVALPLAVQDQIDRPVTDLAHVCGSIPSRNALAAGLINELVPMLLEFAHNGMAPFADEWRAHDTLAGRRISLVLPDRTVSGIARGIDTNGALIVEHDGRNEAFISGHIVVADEP